MRMQQKTLNIHECIYHWPLVYVYVSYALLLYVNYLCHWNGTLSLSRLIDLAMFVRVTWTVCQVTVWPRKHKRKTPLQAFTRSKQIYRIGRSLTFCGTVHCLFIVLASCLLWTEYEICIPTWYEYHNAFLTGLLDSCLLAFIWRSTYYYNVIVQITTRLTSVLLHTNRNAKVKYFKNIIQSLLPYWNIMLLTYYKLALEHIEKHVASLRFQ